MATRIQARYRGYRVRKQIYDKRSDVRRVKAAMTIQRQVSIYPVATASLLANTLLSTMA